MQSCRKGKDLNAICASEKKNYRIRTYLSNTYVNSLLCLDFASYAGGETTVSLSLVFFLNSSLSLRVCVFECMRVEIMSRKSRITEDYGLWRQTKEIVENIHELFAIAKLSVEFACPYWYMFVFFSVPVCSFRSVCFLLFPYSLPESPVI